MDPENISLIGIISVIGGVMALALSAYGAYLFPYSSIPANADLGTLFTTIWQRMVVNISLAIVGIVAILAGTMLYGFGRLAEEVVYSRPAEEREEMKI